MDLYKNQWHDLRTKYQIIALTKLFQCFKLKEMASKNHQKLEFERKT